MNIKWNAEKYAKEFSFVPSYGEELISMLDKDTVHSVLDLGCGSGALTEKLAQEGFAVIGIDGSDAQLQLARQSCPDILFLQKDATDFSLESPVDAVFSNAVFHWINRENQPVMLKCINKALKKNGQLVFECGGYKNADKIHSALRAEFEKRSLNYNFPNYFPTVEEYTELLKNAGFKVVSSRLFDRPTPLKGENGLTDWINMFVKVPFYGISDKVKDEIISNAVEKLRQTMYKDGVWTADYVRLRCKAIKI